MRRHAAIGPAGVALTAALALAGCGGGGAGIPAGAPSALVARGPLEVKLVEEGRLAASRSETYSPEISEGRVRVSYLAPEGTLVAAGDLLVRFDATEFHQEAERLATRLQEMEGEREKAGEDLEILALEKKRRLEERQDEIRLARMADRNLTEGAGPLKVRELEASRDGAARRLEQLRAEYTDLQPLLEKGYITRDELERIGSDLAESEEDLEIAEIKLQTYREFTLPEELEKSRVRLKGLQEELASTGESDTVKEQRLQERLARLAQAIDQARERLEGIRRNIAAAEIRARSPGIVVCQEISDPLTGPRKVQVGDQVFPGQPLITLPDVSEMNALFEIRETDIHHLRLGLPAQVVVRAYPGLELPARISLLGTLAREAGAGGGEKTFQVTARLERSDERLRPGMTVRVEVLVDRAEDALLVPLPAVFSRPGGSFCYVERRFGGWEEREVKTGLAGAERIQVLEGLSEGERVSLAVPPGP